MILGAHMLNAFGHATVAIVQFLEGAGPRVRYSWEPLDTPHPGFHMPADADAADDADDEMTEAYDVPPEGLAQPSRFHPGFELEGDHSVGQNFGGHAIKLPSGIKWAGL